jgi:hypothetical protein
MFDFGVIFELFKVRHDKRGGKISSLPIKTTWLTKRDALIIAQSATAQCICRPKF